MSGNGGPYRTTVVHLRKRRGDRGWGYRLLVLGAPIFLLPVFLIVLLAFCFIVLPLLYLVLCIVLIKSGWRSSEEVGYWVNERG